MQSKVKVISETMVRHHVNPYPNPNAIPSPTLTPSASTAATTTAAATTNATTATSTLLLPPLPFPPASPPHTTTATSLDHVWQKQLAFSCNIIQPPPKMFGHEANTPDCDCSPRPQPLPREGSWSSIHPTRHLWAGLSPFP